MHSRRLQTASHKLAEVLYSQAGAAGEAVKRPAVASRLRRLRPVPTAARPAVDDNVIDAEYVDVDEEKK